MKKYVQLFLAVVLTATLTFAFTTINTTSEKTVEVTEQVKLYSNGKLIGEWRGIGRGQMEGDTYIFNIDRGAFSREMRIRGDFTVETLPN